VTLENGAFAATKNGELVVGLGRTDEPALIFSGTKGLVAMCLLLLIERGQLELDAPVSDVLPFSLPQAGMLDAKNVRSEPFTNVGYGYADRTFSFDGYRRSATSAFTTLKATELQLSDKPGGVCFGDSGGPRLLGSVEVAVTSNGNANCTGQSTSYRLDTASARAFLSQFVAVP